MQRPIKFRAWDNLLDKFVLASYLSEKLVRTYTEDGSRELTLRGTIFTRNGLTLLQYIGLKDKINEKDVYEGDVVRFEVENPDMWSGATIGEVYFEETEACFAIKNKTQSYVTIGHGYDAYPDSLEVIGNIYENPELIK